MNRYTHVELENELSKIRQEISELPIGYISKKTINGKTKQYLQWTEDGKKKSKYVDDELAEELRAKIERRRELQKREKELTFMLPKPQKTEKQVKEKHVFKTDVMLGENLKSYVQTVANYKKRSLYKNICDYVYGDVRDRVFILYGLRRTGKTTLIRQVIAEMDDADFSKTAFIQVSAGIGLSDINQDLKYLMKSGYKYVFIDKKADAIVNERKYKVAPAMVHHIMPGFGTRFGKLTVKICDVSDDNVGNVYNYEFVINKKVSKAYRKNKDIILTVIEIDKQKELYSLTYIDEADKADKDTAEEDIEV